MSNLLKSVLIFSLFLFSSLSIADDKQCLLRCMDKLEACENRAEDKYEGKDITKLVITKKNCGYTAQKCERICEG